MIVPSIDLQGGKTVQLIEGRELAIDAGDPAPIAQNFALVGEIAVIDLDAALRTGSNEQLIKPLLKCHDCRVGGGIRDHGTAIKWLDAGASKIIIGTAATPEFLAELPKERLIAAVDARDGEVVVEGWTKGTGHKLLDQIKELAPFVSGFLVTFVEREGRMGGTDMELAKAVIDAAGHAKVTIAGGVKTPEEIAELDALGADAQVGMALYSGKLGLAEAFLAPAKSDRADGLLPTVVVDEHGTALGLVYSNQASVEAALNEQRGIYHSRTRGLWRKGETSGAHQELLSMALDCDRDALRFVVRQHGAGFCHLETQTCWGEDWGLGRLMRRLEERAKSAPAGSYTAKLFADPELLASKIVEEANELNEAAAKDDVIHEAADVIFFTLTRLAKEQIGLAELAQHLDARARKVTRRN